jgi:hypothetical protein
MEVASRYNLLINNCEHFVNWCIEDDANSSQVEGVGMFAAGPLGLPVGAGAAFGLTPLWQQKQSQGFPGQVL